MHSLLIIHKCAYINFFEFTFTLTAYLILSMFCWKANWNIEIHFSVSKFQSEKLHKKLALLYSKSIIIITIRNASDISRKQKRIRWKCLRAQRYLVIKLFASISYFQCKAIVLNSFPRLLFHYTIFHHLSLHVSRNFIFTTGKVFCSSFFLVFFLKFECFLM